MESLVKHGENLSSRRCLSCGYYRVMNATRAKNFLQEYCQKNKVKFPVYDTTGKRLEDGHLRWSSKVTVEGKTYRSTSEAHRSKKGAEQDAASVAYFGITKILVPSMINTSEKTSAMSKYYQTEVVTGNDLVKVVMDVENMAGSTTFLLDDLAHGTPTIMHITFVASSSCQFLDRLRDDVSNISSPNVTLEVTTSTLPDAADMLICALVMEDVNLPVIIVTKDKFAITLAAMMKERYDVDVTVIRSEAEFVNLVRV